MHPCCCLPASSSLCSFPPRADATTARPPAFLRERTQLASASSPQPCILSHQIWPQLRLQCWLGGRGGGVRIPGQAPQPWYIVLAPPISMALATSFITCLSNLLQVHRGCIGLSHKNMYNVNGRQMFFNTRRSKLKFVIYVFRVDYRWLIPKEFQICILLLDYSCNEMPCFRPPSEIRAYCTSRPCSKETLLTQLPASPLRKHASF